MKLIIILVLIAMILTNFLEAGKLNQISMLVNLRLYEGLVVSLNNIRRLTQKSSLILVKVSS